MKDGTHKALDLLILATGFRTTQFMYPIRIFGSNGRSLTDTWNEHGAEAYLGITVAGMPNFGMLYGPNTNLAHNSLILVIEAQSLYISHLISAVLGAKRSGKSLSLAPKSTVVEAYNEEVQQRLSKSTFADPNCTSWFKDEKGRITTNWCGSAVDYQERTNSIDLQDYNILGSAGAEMEGKGVVKWRRRVEETQISDRTLRLGAIGVAVLALGGGWWVWGGGAGFSGIWSWLWRWDRWGATERGAVGSWVRR